MPIQAAEYSRIAAVFNYVTQQWDKEPLDINQLQIQFDLPLIALGYVQEQISTMRKNTMAFLCGKNLQSKAS